MDVIAFFLLVFLFFYFVRWEAILLAILYFALVGLAIHFAKRFDKEGRLTLLGLVSAVVIVTVLFFSGMYGFSEYSR